VKSGSRHDQIARCAATSSEKNSLPRERVTYAKFSLTIAVGKTDGDTTARVVPTSDHTPVKSLDDLFTCLACLKPTDLSAKRHEDEVDSDRPNEGNYARRVGEFRLEEPAALDDMRRDKRSQGRLVDAQRKTIHSSIMNTIERKKEKRTYPSI
jgi:hypothetical protein